MKKYFSKIFTISLIIILLGGNLKVFAEGDFPQNITVDTNRKIVGSVRYDDYIIESQKIISNIGLGYCLEIERDYPAGQTFKIAETPSAQLDKILDYGYPNLSAEELGLDNEDDAYFATQVALWSYYEGYDVHKFKGENKKLLDAVINIYENAINKPTYNLSRIYKVYSFNNKTQRVVIEVVDQENGNLEEGSGK